MASNRTMPNDSPPSDGAHRTSAATSRRTFSSSVRTPSQCDVGRARDEPAQGRRSRGRRRRSTDRRPAPSARTGAGRSTGHAVERLEQDPQTLALLVATEEQDGRAVGGPRSTSGPVHLHAVEPDLVVPPRARSAVARPPRTLRTGRRSRRASRRASGPEHRVEGTPPAAVEGGHQRREPPTDQQAVGKAGGERLVHVHDVEAPGRRVRTARTDGGDRETDRGHRAVGRERDRAAGRPPGRSRRRVGRRRRAGRTR